MNKLKNKEAMFLNILSIDYINNFTRLVPTQPRIMYISY